MAAMQTAEDSLVDTLEEGSLLEMEEIPDVPANVRGVHVPRESTGPWKFMKKTAGYSTLVAVVLGSACWTFRVKATSYENPFWPPPPFILDSSMLPTGQRLHDLTAVVQKYVPRALDHSEFVKASNTSELSLNIENASYWMRKLQEGVDKMELSPRRNLEISVCAFDAYQIVITIGSIINGIEGLRSPCSQPYPLDVGKRTTCAGLVMLEMSFFGFILTYVTDAVSSCPGKFNLKAGCALGAGGFLTTLIKIGATGATLSGNCKQGIGPAPPPVNPEELSKAAFKGLPADVRTRLEQKWKLYLERQQQRRDDFFSWAIAGGRRLENTSATDSRRLEEKVLAKLPVDPLEPTPPQAVQATDRSMASPGKENADKQWATSACVIDTQNFAAKLAATGNSMGFSALDCKQEYFDKRGHPGKNKCAIDIGLLVGNIAIAANMIALDVINCPATLEYNPDALCAGGIIDIVARCGFLVVAFAGIQDSCGSLDE